MTKECLAKGYFQDGTRVVRLQLEVYLSKTKLKLQVGI